jgi:hypothetical protein
MTPQLFMTFLAERVADVESIRATLFANYFTVSVPDGLGERAEYVVRRQPPLERKLVPRTSAPDANFDDRSAPFDAHVLAVTPFADIENRLRDLPYLELSPTEGPSVMVTAQLSGCTIVYRPAREASDNVKLIHIQPAPHRTGWELQEQLERANPRFRGDLLPTRLYGRKDHGRLMHSNLVALRQDGKWHLFAQEFTAVGSSIAVRKVEAIPLFI